MPLPKTLFLDLIGECGLICSGDLFLDGAFSKVRPFWLKGRHWKWNHLWVTVQPVMCTRVSQQSAHRVCQPRQKQLTATYIGLYLYLNLHLSLLDLKDHASDQVSLSLFKMCILIFDIQVKYKTIGTLSLSIIWPPCKLSCIRQRCNWNKVQVNTRKWPGVFAQFNMCALLWTTQLWFYLCFFVPLAESIICLHVTMYCRPNYSKLMPH